MNDDNFLDTLTTRLTQSASVKNVFGEPIHAGDKVIIPVAQVMLGMGGGYGHGTQKNKQLPLPDLSQRTSQDNPETAGGGGGGGGLYATAKGVFEVTPKGTRFVPAHDWRHLVTVLTVGFVLGRLLR